MDNFTPDESQLKALTTWYAKDDPLHLDSRHPCIKLAGECGELLDLYAKDEYKPNFSWWNCKHCGYGDASHSGIYRECYEFKGYYTPKVLDELGDISYYLRILAYQKGMTFEELCEGFKQYQHYYIENDLLNLLSSLLGDSHQILSDYLDDGIIEIGHLKYCAYNFLAILHKLDCPLERLLELNYRKLNTESQHGWANATIKR